MKTKCREPLRQKRVARLASNPLGRNRETRQARRHEDQEKTTWTLENWMAQSCLCLTNWIYLFEKACILAFI